MLKSKVLFIVMISAVLFQDSLSQQHFSNIWNVYTCMKNVSGVGLSGSKVWVATSGGLFTFDYINSANIKKFTILDGLLSNELTCDAVDNSGNIWTGGIDGSVGVFNPSGNTWKTIADISSSTETSKAIYDFFQYGNSMFISTAFSLIQFSVTRFQFIDQPYVYLGSLPAKTPVFQTIVINDTVWAATKNGIAYANINSELPIQTNWRNFTTSNSVLRSNQINSAIYFDNKVVFATDTGGMVYFQNGILNTFTPLCNGVPVQNSINKLAVSGNSLYFSTHNSTNNLFRVDKGDLGTAFQILNGIPINALKVSPTGELIIGTANKGINIYKNNVSSYVVPNGPNSNIFTSLEVDAAGNIWGSSGGTGEGVYRFNGTTWRNFTTDNTPPQQIGGGDYRHIYASKFSAAVYCGGYGDGLLKIVGDSITRFDNTNSCLAAFGGNFVLVEGISEDNNGRLWVINRAAPYPILQFNEPPNNCFPFPTPYNQAATSILFLDIDRYNTKWMTLPNDVEGSPRGIIYFNESSPGSGLIIDATNLGQNVTGANDLVVDKNGEVWVATDNGISIIHDPYQIISNPNTVPQIVKMQLIENGLETPLQENVSCIGVDALNNKWIGTLSNGLIYVSSDGTTLISRYNMSNSPLPDNNISSVVIDPKTGNAYFGTEKGLVSLQTIAVQPLDNCDKIKVGPSPFIIPNSSLLRIDGLVAESTVKILTISGKLINEFQTEGGRITNWDGRDLNGNLVSSGIYIVAGYNKDETQVCTGKIAVIRR